MKIRALVPFSTGTITMEKYEIKEVSYEVGARLVTAGLVTEISGGGGGSNALVVTDTNGTLDKTWQEIHDAMLSGGAVISEDNPMRINAIISCCIDAHAGAYLVIDYLGMTYESSSASDYPVLSE